jgi:uncharacterized protein (TIGR03032 family)
VSDDAAGLWSTHDAQWRDPAQVVAQWAEAGVDKRLVAHRATKDFWEELARLDVTVLVTREYEHLMMALTVHQGRPHVTFLSLPHPSGIAVDEKHQHVHVAATRNPNQIFTLAPARAALNRGDARAPALDDRPLVPLRSRFLPGSLYVHDLALIGGKLHGNAVAHNAVVSIDAENGWKRVWWPKTIETGAGPDWSRNYLQLNSIAAGRTLRDSFFSASSEAPGRKRPGMLGYPVDGRGVIFSGRTREVIARGLTRPHSARFDAASGRLWVDNSGYGEVGVIEDGGFTAVARLPGWTRGLAFRDGVALVATSRVIPRFRAYAPGLDVDRSVCGLHVVDTSSGRVLASLRWPYGNQVFAVECVSRSMTLGLPFTGRNPSSGSRARNLFYAFATENQED